MAARKKKRARGALESHSASDPRFYAKKAAAEETAGRKLSRAEFIAEHYDAPAGADGVAGTNGVSLFDPVLAELIVRWWSPLGGLVLDPFAGGSVRGLVAAKCGRRYVGVDLRGEQVAANREQAKALLAKGDPVPEWVEGDSRDLGKLRAEFEALSLEWPAPDGFDLVFSCPPYGDLEVYSDDPRDLSRASWSEFEKAYRAIVREACGLLRQDRFACFVVGDFRDPKGFYRGFPWLTVEAFQAAGLKLYNEAVLVTPLGQLPMIVSQRFTKARKLGKTHQNVLVFVKGDPRRAAEACGDLDVAVDPAEVFGSVLPPALPS